MTSLVVNSNSHALQNNAENPTAGWITEWVGPVGRSACFAGVQASTLLSPDPTRVVVQYLRKNAQVDLPDFEEAIGKNKVKELLGGNSDQIAIPFQIEKLLQTDLANLFSDQEILAGFGAKTKLTEISSLFFKVQGLSPQIFLGLEVSCVDLEEMSAPFLEQPVNGCETENQWIIALDEPIALDQGMKAQNKLVPAGAEIPCFVDKTYTVLASALPNVNLPISSTGTRCKEEGANHLGTFCMTVRYQPPVEEGENGEIVLGYDDFDFALGIQWKVPAEKAKETT